MRLELDVLNIKDIQFAGKTTIADGVLRVNRSGLQELLLEDRRLGQVDIELAHPGEKCRILQVSDVVEPRAKTGGSGEDFPFVARHKTAAMDSGTYRQGRCQYISSGGRTTDQAGGQ